VQADDEVDPEGQVDPRRPLALLQADGLAVDLDRRALRRAVPVNGERQANVLDGLQLGVRVASTAIGRASSDRYPSVGQLLPSAGPAARVPRPDALLDGTA
jgi:hypothetical protein